MDFDRFVARLSALLRLDIPAPATPYDGLYDDLELDSVQALELVIIVEGLADCLVPPAEVPELFTLGDAFAYYQQLRAAQLAGTAETAET